MGRAGPLPRGGGGASTSGRARARGGGGAGQLGIPARPPLRRLVPHAAGGAGGKAAPARAGAGAGSGAGPQQLPTSLRPSEKAGIVCVEGGDVLAIEAGRGGRGGSVYRAGPGGRLERGKAQDVREPSRLLGQTLERLLLPEGGVEAVTPDYFRFSFFNFLRSTAAAATGVLATQGLLIAAGVTAGKAAAASAVVNWVLKDGLGRLGCILVAWGVGSRFDDDAKTFFLLGDVAYELGVLVEILSPLCPALFLPVASVGNALKSISYMVRIPPRTAILRSFCRKENLGDVSAKSNSQDVVSGVLGIGLGIWATSVVQGSVQKALGVYSLAVIFVGLFSKASLSHLELKTLNRQRLSILMEEFVRTGAVSGPRDVNRKEMVPTFLSQAARQRKRAVVFGAHLLKTSKGDLRTFNRMRALYRGCDYLLGPQWDPRGEAAGRVNMTVRQDATTTGTLQGLLQAEWHRQRAEPGRDGATLWQHLVEGQRFAAAKVPELVAALKEQGWNTATLQFHPKNTASWQLYEGVPFDGDDELLGSWLAEMEKAASPVPPPS